MRNNHNATEETAVLVVGAGPAGLVTAIGLARSGVPVMLVERHTSTSIFPAATAISARSMEIMREWGLEEKVRARGFSAVPTGRIAASLVATEGLVVPLGAPTQEEIRHASPTSLAMAAQDAFEPVLLEHLQTFASDVRFGTELVSFVQDQTGVTAVLRNLATGAQGTVRSRYLVAADGGRSSIRASLGIKMDGPERLEEYVSTLFRAPLSEHVSAPVHALNMITGPAGMTVLLPTSGDDRWVLAHPCDPGTMSVEAFSPSRVTQLVRQATGVPDLRVDVLNVNAFSFAAQNAERYRAGQVFLVGDAAHRITPRGGTGMNTAIHDGHNLAWKLAFVYKGWAQQELLDTYETERRPVGEQNSVRSAQPTSPDVDALGIDIGVTYDVGAISDASPDCRTGPWRPSGRPGARLPHLWLETDAGRLSTLDLLGSGLTVLTGPEGGAWRSALSSRQEATRVPMQLSIVGTKRLRDLRAEFCALLDIDADGVVIVRPDGHIAWRARSGRGIDVVVELGRGIRAALGAEAETAAAPLAERVA